MSSFQWNSLQDLVAIQEKMNRLFEETIHRTEFPDEGVETALWSPAADVYETPEEIILQVELPGVRLADVHLEALDGKLRVSGHRRANPEVEPERFGIHPQTLRLYEREGLLRPVRTEGNTRLYDSDTIERLEIILTLTRDLGVNLAGVEVILHMKEKIERMQGDVHHLLSVLREEVEARRVEPDRRYALTTVSKSLALAKLDKR